MVTVKGQAGPKGYLAHESAIRSRRYESRFAFGSDLAARRGPRRAIKAIKLALHVILATRLRMAQIAIGRADSAAKAHLSTDYEWLCKL